MTSLLSTTTAEILEAALDLRPPLFRRRNGVQNMVVYHRRHRNTLLLRQRIRERRNRVLAATVLMALPYVDVPICVRSVPSDLLPSDTEAGRLCRGFQSGV